MVFLSSSVDSGKEDEVVLFIAVGIVHLLPQKFPTC